MGGGGSSQFAHCINPILTRAKSCAPVSVKALISRRPRRCETSKTHLRKFDLRRSGLRQELFRSVGEKLQLEPLAETLWYHVITTPSHSPNNTCEPAQPSQWLWRSRCSSELISRIQLDLEFDRSWGTFAHFSPLFFLASRILWTGCLSHALLTADYCGLCAISWDKGSPLPSGGGGRQPGSDQKTRFYCF